jgi:hypothetical protein
MVMLQSDCIDVMKCLSENVISFTSKKILRNLFNPGNVLLINKKFLKNPLSEKNVCRKLRKFFSDENFFILKNGKYLSMIGWPFTVRQVWDS